MRITVDFGEHRFGFGRGIATAWGVCKDLTPNEITPEIACGTLVGRMSVERR
jgi:hypothetical protein